MLISGTVCQMDLRSQYDILRLGIRHGIQADTMKAAGLMGFWTALALFVVVSGLRAWAQAPERISKTGFGCACRGSTLDICFIKMFYWATFACFGTFSGLGQGMVSYQLSRKIAIQHGSSLGAVSLRISDCLT